MALSAISTVAVVLTAGLAWDVPGAVALDRDCGDFPNQAAAEKYFLSKGGPDLDPDRLDQDGDGVACQGLPCPCIGAPNTDLWISAILFGVLFLGSTAFFWWRLRLMRTPLEGRAFIVGGLMVLSTLLAALAVVNFALAEPLIEDIVPFVLAILIPALAGGLIGLLAHASERKGA